MNLSGIHPYFGMYDYNITNDPSNGRIAAQQAESRERDSAVETGQGAKEPQGQESPYRQTRKLEDSYDYAQRYEPGRSYEMKGRDSALESLDMEQAISKMQQDQLLRQYQFFVGSSAREEQNHRQTWNMPYENFNI